MNAFYQAIAENNRSVGLISSGDYEAAIDGQTRALSIIKKFMDLHGDQLPKTSAHRTSLDQCMTASCCTFEEDDDMQHEFLYQQGVVIPMDIHPDQDIGALVSCMIIFNFALACQLSASSSAGEEVVIANLNKAIKLYQLSFNLQRNANMDGNVLFSLAVVNNLGICHRQLHNQEDSGKCFEYVLSTLMFLTDCGEVSELYKYLDGFFFNVAHLISQPTVAPAA